MRMVWALFLVIYLGLFGQVSAETVTIAVASNFASPMKKLATIFEEQSSHKVKTVIGSSGKIYAQIINGAPFDVFFSADQAKPSLLIEQQMAVMDSQYSYATGILVLWAPHLDIFAPRTPNDPHDKIAIANPKTAPYGTAAWQAIRHLDMQVEMGADIIRAENVMQVYQFVDSRAVGIGLLALSQVIGQPEGSYIVINEDIYEPIVQDLVLLNRGQDNPAALEFLDFVKSEKVKDIIKSLGYK